MIIGKLPGHAVLSVAALLLAPLAQAQITSLDLGNYQLSGTYALPSVEASEASAVTWNWNTNSLFVLGDEGEAVVEVSRTGSLLSSMSLSGFGDTEGLTYIGGNQFVLVEERLQDAYLFTYTAGGALARSSLQSASLGPTIGNIGLEGISFDPVTSRFVVVKEKDPQAVYDASLNFGTGAATVSSLFTPALGVSDLSDVQVLSTVSSLLGTTDADNLLIYSQESARLLEVTRDGSILSSFDFSALSGSAEGVTIADDGTIFVVDEGPNLYVLTPSPVPLPAAAWLLISGLGAVGLGARRRKPLTA